MSAQDFLADAITRRQIMIQRAGRGVARELEVVLDDLRKQLQTRLAEASTEFQRRRLGVLLSSIDGIIDGTNERFSQTLIERLSQFTDGEIEFQKQMLDQVLTAETVVPPTERLTAAVTTRPATLLIGGQPQTMSVNQMVETFARSQKQEIKNLISAGFIAGDTPDQIGRRISQKVRGRTRAQARTVAQTAMNHAATVAREEFARENGQFLEGERFVATLDVRTTPTCSGLDGQIFDVGRGPMPPLHYNCRSIRVAEPREGSVLSGLEGTRPAVGADGVEQVSSRKTFSGWLRGQPADFQRDFFSKYRNGEQKYELFKQGGLSPNDFIDADGAEISLDELRQKNPLAFQQVTPTD